MSSSQKLEKTFKRIVIKIGSSLFYSGKEFDLLRLFEIVSHISSLIKNEKKEVVIVSSGAIALGMNQMDLNKRPKELPLLQAAAAIGQSVLMDNYGEQFKRYQITPAQILLTWDDFDDRQRYLNAKNTLLRLLSLGCVPIINENDTISTEEIKFGDNDRLSAMVASMVAADLLIILSDVDGLLDREGKVVKLVDDITPQIRALACPTDKKTCVGGMITKIDAAKIAVDSGIPCVIANGSERNIISSISNNPTAAGTLFAPKKSIAAKQRWIAFGTRPTGKIFIDDGAKAALLNKKSLLSVGIVRCEGAFDAGDIVSVMDREGVELARGKSSLPGRQVEKIKGKRFEREVIHRDNIVILNGE